MTNSVVNLEKEKIENLIYEVRGQMAFNSASRLRLASFSLSS